MCHRRFNLINQVNELRDLIVEVINPLGQPRRRRLDSSHVTIEQLCIAVDRRQSCLDLQQSIDSIHERSPPSVFPAGNVSGRMTGRLCLRRGCAMWGMGHEG